MTPTEQDKELESRLEDLAYWMYESSGRSKYIRADRPSLHPDEAVKILKQLITADRKRVALEARMDEVNSAFLIGGLYREYYDTRTDELKTLEEV